MELRVVMAVTTGKVQVRCVGGSIRHTRRAGRETGAVPVFLSLQREFCCKPTSSY